MFYFIGDVAGICLSHWAPCQAATASRACSTHRHGAASACSKTTKLYRRSLGRTTPARSSTKWNTCLRLCSLSLFPLFPSLNIVCVTSLSLNIARALSLNMVCVCVRALSLCKVYGVCVLMYILYFVRIIDRCATRATRKSMRWHLHVLCFCAAAEEMQQWLKKVTYISILYNQKALRACGGEAHALCMLFFCLMTAVCMCAWECFVHCLLSCKICVCVRACSLSIKYMVCVCVRSLSLASVNIVCVCALSLSKYCVCVRSLSLASVNIVCVCVLSL